MADVWASTVTNRLRDLAVYKARLSALTLGKVQEGKNPGTDKLTFGKAS